MAKLTMTVRPGWLLVEPTDYEHEHESGILEGRGAWRVIESGGPDYMTAHLSDFKVRAGDLALLKSVPQKLGGWNGRSFVPNSDVLAVLRP
jgi:hypothetical protein